MRRVLAALSVAFPISSAAQSPAFDWRIGAMSVAAATRSAPAVFGRTLTEGYFTQPNVMADLRWRGVQFDGTLNFEGYTLRRGELNAGMYGEGYVDRRHPHTLVHEAMLGVVSPRVGGARASISAGKGFTPFGTDDPMMRPFVKYPVNHHHAQIIERAVVTGALALGDPVRGRGAAVEYGVFNGDEPYDPFVAPTWDRVGDSRSARLTVKPAPAFELQGSRAFVRSPGIVQGGAFDHTQTSISARYQPHVDASAHAGHESHRGSTGPTHDARRPAGESPRLSYALLEVARTDEGFGSDRIFRYESALAEAQVEWRGARLAVRGESTERPETERLLDPFRTSVGHIDFSIIGVTRWRIATVHLGSPAIAVRSVGGVVPFVEVARAAATARRRPSVFEPAEFYGNAVQWSFTAGLRLHLGEMRSRMGRYGVLAP